MTEQEALGELIATHMELQLAGADGPALPEAGAVVLRSMTAAELDAFLSVETVNYAAARERSGEPPDVAAETARQQMAQLIPAGLDSPGQRFWIGEADGNRVGCLWVDVSKPRAFVYDIMVDEGQRRRGYGSQLMTAGARWCRDHGSTSLALNVFGYNTGARALYEQLGYTVTDEIRAPIA